MELTLQGYTSLVDRSPSLRRFILTRCSCLAGVERAGLGAGRPLSTYAWGGRARPRHPVTCVRRWRGGGITHVGASSALTEVQGPVRFPFGTGSVSPGS